MPPAVYDRACVEEVKRLVKGRFREMGVTGQIVAQHLGIHPTALSTLISPNNSTQTRNLHTLDKLSAHLGLESGELRRILQGREKPPPTPRPSVSDSLARERHHSPLRSRLIAVEKELAEMRRELAELRPLVRRMNKVLAEFEATA